MNDRFLSYKEAMRVFLYSRLILLGVTCVCILLLPLLIPGYIAWIDPNYHVLSSVPLNQLLVAWMRWDAVHYLNISFRGYTNVVDTAFFPLWPLLQHLGGLALGKPSPLSFYLSGLLLANLCFFFDLVLLYQLLEKRYGRSIARRTLFYFTFSPCAIFFFAGYSETLFVFLCLTFFLFLERGSAYDWWLAGLCCLLAGLTRSLGVVLGVPYLVIYVQRFWWKQVKSTWKQRINALLPLALVPLGPLMYMVYLFYTKGNPLIFQAQENAIWHRQLTFPLISLVLGVVAVFQVPDLLMKASNIFDLLSVVIFFVALCSKWKALPLHYVFFMLFMVLGSLCWPVYVPFSPLLSQPRFMIILFPIALIFALWDKGRRIDLGLRVLSVLCFVICAGLFISNVWLA